MTVTIYCDGSSSPADHSGGWAAVLSYKGREKVVSGHELDTTNQRMELMAAIGALSALKAGRRWKVKIYSDSAYLVNCFQKGWIENWRTNGWMTYRNKPVANQELWVRLNTLVFLYDVEFIHVKGHAGNMLNERVDRLASEARRLGIEQRRNHKEPGTVIYVCKR